MRPNRRRPGAPRTSRFESFEPRLVMSGLYGGQLSLDYFVEGQASSEVGTALADAHALTGLDQARREFGLTGQGQTVVVIDTGIAYDHLALGGGYGSGYHVVGGFDFTEEYDGDPYDDGPLGSHGTHVAGIIASQNAANPGVAPGVDLVALRVFNDAGEGYFQWIEQALAWVHDNLNSFANPITTVNLSIGSSYNADAPPSWTTIEDELAVLESDGLFISVAAGNAFNGNQRPGLSYPAASPYVVPVASVDDNGQLSYFSQRSDRVIAAPGRSVTSTVPDYVGNRNGVGDDFAAYSGTSMAAPYVAGAAVLIREAYSFAGVEHVTQNDIYDVMRSTADMVYDPITGVGYPRLNLQRAIDSIMPADDYGSYAYAAENLGRLDSSAEGLSISGAIGAVDDRDYFTFTAAQTGTVTLTAAVSQSLAPDWEVAGVQFAVNPDDGSLSFEASAGQSYTIGLGTQAGIGHYTIDFRLETAVAPPPAKGVRQREILDQSVSAAGQWFAFTAAQDGILTVEAHFANSKGDVDLQLYDGSQRFVGGSYTTSNAERIDVAAKAGQTFYVYAYNCGAGVNDGVDIRITNMVAQVGRSVVVTGSEGDDSFAFAAGTTCEISVNGVSYTFDARAIDAVSFDGRGGTDTATLSGSSGNDTARLQVGKAELTGPGYAATALNVEDVTVRGGPGGVDTAFLYDSPGDDVLTASAAESQLAGAGFSSRAVGFDYVHAYSTQGGTDVARLYDSAGDDSLLATPVYARIYGDGYAIRAKHFQAVYAYATAGGHDAAWLFGSEGDDLFLSTSSYATMSGDGYLNRARHFEQVYARPGQGGYDRAEMFDAASDDQFVAAGSTAHLVNATQAVWAFAFDNLDVYATAGGTNHAEVAAVDYLLKLLGDWQ